MSDCTSGDGSKKRTVVSERWDVFACLCVIVCYIWLFSWSSIDIFIADKSRGEFGDKFGAINSLFSGFAFATLIYALFLQMEELRLQRDELKDTRAVLKEQKEEFSQQNENLKRQRFENTFFQMLENFSRVTLGLRGAVRTGNNSAVTEDFTGARMLHALVSCVHRGLKEQFMYRATTAPDKFNKNITNILRDEWIKSSERRVTVYLNMVLQIVDFIERENVKDEFSGDTTLYMNIFKCSLSIDEMEALYLFSPLHSDRRLAPLLKKYNFFDDVFECFSEKTQVFRFLH
ncbi:putative phage abortive infection protein [Micavibrio aeruginosavorus]|uniref:Phage abortive infection protein n=1 Tax=Micavibrio aeruginosavorus (strain ARL-13) TaxID=856793 RepID=G2KSD6_MICAA|nr:putative phage abortive infection protein [Micavibrio aeruginosavorus]AEP09220.1 putative uncharacterized protein [Micavibrio aeruginosavorus ARL-13]